MKLSFPARNRLMGLIDVLGLSMFAGLLVARFIPVARLPFWGCALRKFTGWPCPTCGLTRVMDQLSHFSIVGAFKANPLGAVVALGLVALGIASVVHLAFGVPMPVLNLNEREARRIRIGVVALVLINYVFVIITTKFPTLL